ncbi:mitochondrial import inner membrane translocase subunit Tim10 [Vespula squamosa]|uniref:Mitochondrial import inner membrane translocase subunit Tim10 n=1 Tax=Vespula squamosa TaxID=30214 RepID=A0ABD2BEH6_VESSQ
MVHAIVQLGLCFPESSFNFLKTKTMKLGPHQKIAIGWAIVVSLGIYSFALSRKSIDSKRYEKNMATLPQLDEEKLKLVQDLEIEMMSDMYNRMTSACHRKCIPPKYIEPELGKGESICLDRCVAKYLDVHERIGKKLTQISMQEDNFMKNKIAEQPKTS